LGKDTDNKRIDDIDKLQAKIRKRKGGRGRTRMSDSAKMKIILSKLDPVEFMDPDKPGFRYGHYPGEILGFIPRTRNWRDTKIIDKLEDSGFITCRGARHDERGDKYCYRTERGKRFLDSLQHLN